MLKFFTRKEKLVLILLLMIIVFSGYGLYSRFVRDNSDLIPADGGIYTEGVVGRPQILNPLLLSSAVDQDVSRLVFSGLTKFNPQTGLIEDDVATSQRSNGNLTYTFTLLPDAVWHDGVSVTADDVLFTFQGVIQNESFANHFLRQTFKGVKIEKIDERSVAFHLPEPYSFFLANVAVGLLPRHLLEFVPVENLAKSEFNLSPIGCGPYRFASWSSSQEGAEITLHAFDGYYAALPKIQTVIFRAFPTQEALLLAQNTLSGFHLLPGQNPRDVLGQNSRFEYYPYQLPQYTALFLNTDSKVLSNRKVRFALLLATNKQEFVDATGHAEIVDTPVLESKGSSDIEFSLERSMGAFYDTEWNLPAKVQPAKPASASDQKSEQGDPNPVGEVIPDTAEQIELKKVRINDKGQRLILRLVTTQAQPSFLQVAELVRRQWLEAGAKVVIETYPIDEIQQKIRDRDYDILLFGQNLGYNLDAFPFWHSSQSGTGLNLAQYKSLEVDNLLVAVRRTFDDRTKARLLDRLKSVIAVDTPAVFLYSPIHYYAVDSSVRNVQIAQLSGHADRLTDLVNWYTKEKYRLKPSFGFSQLIDWILRF